MTIKLLTPRDLTIGGRLATYPAGALVTLDSATEAGLVTSKEATSDLTGGVVFTPPVPSGQPLNVTARVSPGDGGIELYVGTVRMLGRKSDFKPMIFWSGIVGATYAQAGNTVTVTATAHGLPSHATREGWRVWWPGSAAVAAGWYDGYHYVSANSFTFTNPTSQTISAGTAVDSLSAAAWTTETVAISTTLPGGSLGPQGVYQLDVTRFGDTTAGGKTIRVYYGGAALSISAPTTAPNGRATFSFANAGSKSVQVGHQNDGAPTSTNYNATVNSAVDQTVELRLQLANAGQYLELANVIERVTP